MRMYAEGREVIHEFNLTLKRYSNESSLATEIRAAMTMQYKELAAVLMNLMPRGKRDLNRTDLVDLSATIEGGVLVVGEPRIGWKSALKYAIAVENQRILPLRVTIAPCHPSSSPPLKIRRTTDTQTTATDDLLEDTVKLEPFNLDDTPFSMANTFLDTNPYSASDHDPNAIYATAAAAAAAPQNYISGPSPYITESHLASGAQGRTDYAAAAAANQMYSGADAYNEVCTPPMSFYGTPGGGIPGGNPSQPIYCPNPQTMAVPAHSNQLSRAYGAYATASVPGSAQQFEAMYGASHALTGCTTTSTTHRRHNNANKQSQTHRSVDTPYGSGRPFSPPTEYRIDYRAHAELLPAMSCNDPPYTEADLMTMQHQSVAREFAPYILCSVAPVCRPDSPLQHLKSNVPLPVFSFPGEFSCALSVTRYNQTGPQPRSQRSLSQARHNKRTRDTQSNSGDKSISWVHVEKMEDFPFQPIPWQLAENPVYPMNVFILQLIAAKSPIIPCIPLRCRALATLEYKRPEDYMNMVDKCAMGKLRQEFFNSCAHLGLKIGTDAFPGIPGSMTVYQYYSMFIWCLTQGGCNKAAGDSVFWGRCVRAVFPQSLPPLELDAAAGALRRLYNWTLIGAENMLDQSIRMELCDKDQQPLLHEQLMKSSPSYATPSQSPPAPMDGGQWIDNAGGLSESNGYWTAGYTPNSGCYHTAPQQHNPYAQHPSSSASGWANGHNNGGALPPTFHSGRHTDSSLSDLEIEKLMWGDSTVSLSIRDEAEAAVVDISTVRSETVFMKNVHIAIVLLRTYGRLKLINEAALRASRAKSQNESVPVFDIGLDKGSQRDFLVKPELLDMVAYYRFITVAAIRHIEEPSNPKGPNVLELDEPSFVSIARHSLRIQQSRNPLMYLPTGEPPHINHWPPPPKWTISKKTWEDYPTAQIYSSFRPPPRPTPPQQFYSPHPSAMLQQGYIPAPPHTSGSMGPPPVYSAAAAPPMPQPTPEHHPLMMYRLPPRQQYHQAPPKSLINTHRHRPSMDDSIVPPPLPQPMKSYVPYQGKYERSPTPPPPLSRDEGEDEEVQPPPVPPPSPVKSVECINIAVRTIKTSDEQHCIASPISSQNSAVTAEQDIVAVPDEEGTAPAAAEKEPPICCDLKQESPVGEEEEDEDDGSTTTTAHKGSVAEVALPNAPIQTAFSYVRSSRNTHKVRLFREPRRIAERSQQRKRVHKPEPAKPPNRNDEMNRRAQMFIKTWNRAAASSLNRHPGEALLTVIRLNQPNKDPNDPTPFTSNADQVSVNLSCDGATIVPNRTFLTYIKNGLGATVPKASLRLTNTRKRGNNRIPAPGAITAGSSANRAARLHGLAHRKPPPRPAASTKREEQRGPPDNTPQEEQEPPPTNLLPLPLPPQTTTTTATQSSSQLQPAVAQLQPAASQVLPAVAQPAPAVHQTSRDRLISPSSSCSSSVVECSKPPPVRGQKRPIPPRPEEMHKGGAQKPLPTNDRSAKRSRLGDFEQLPPVPRAHHRNNNNPLAAAAAQLESPPSIPPPLPPSSSSYVTAPTPTPQQTVSHPGWQPKYHQQGRPVSAPQTGSNAQRGLRSSTQQAIPRQPHRVSAVANPTPRRSSNASVVSISAGAPTPQVRREPSAQARGSLSHHYPPQQYSSYPPQQANRWSYEYGAVAPTPSYHTAANYMMEPPPDPAYNHRNVYMNAPPQHHRSQPMPRGAGDLAGRHYQHFSAGARQPYQQPPPQSFPPNDFVSSAMRALEAAGLSGSQITQEIRDGRVVFTISNDKAPQAPGGSGVPYWACDGGADTPGCEAPMDINNELPYRQQPKYHPQGLSNDCTEHHRCMRRLATPSPPLNGTHQVMRQQNNKHHCMVVANTPKRRVSGHPTT